MVNPKRDGTLESRPSDSAQGSQFRKVRGKMGHPRGILSRNSRSILASRGFLCVLKLTDLDGSFRELGDDS